jgi:bifunctional enzyme CysN/CysC
VPDDVLAAARRDSRRHGAPALAGDGDLDYSLLVDGLEAEREQGITIDVAYRYFATPRRKFILADTPGHEQYTRNMATGASTAQLAAILVDAGKGVLLQTRRHAFIASLLGIRHLVVAVNKMDRVGYGEEAYDRVRRDFTDFAAKLDVGDLHFIPVSALAGDNVVVPSARMPWYRGAPLLDYLETVHVASDLNLIDLRLPIQSVLRAGGGYRGVCGTLASGVLARGQEVLVLPSRRRARIAALATPAGEAESAAAPQAVAVTLDRDLDVGRGDMLVAPGNVPELGRVFDAMLVWMGDEPLAVGREYLLQHTTVAAAGVVTDVRYRLDPQDLHRQPAGGLATNEIGRVRLEASRPLAFDAYARNRGTGAFILVDRLSHATVAAGMVLDRQSADELELPRQAPDAASNVRPAAAEPAGEPARAGRLGQRPFCVWLTGLPRSGKSTLAAGLEAALLDRGVIATALDGEALRLGVNRDLGFSPGDRGENVRRTAELARLLADSGLAVVVALVSPSAADRELARRIVGAERFVEVHCSAPLAVCEARDEAGLFAKARRGEVEHVTGIQEPYEPPPDPDLEVATDRLSPAEAVARVLADLAERGLLERRGGPA